MIPPQKVSIMTCSQDDTPVSPREHLIRAAKYTYNHYCQSRLFAWQQLLIRFFAKLHLLTNRGIVLRHDLSNFLHTGETVVYSCDETPGTKKSSMLSTEAALFLFLGSFFIIALIATFAFGIAHGESFAYVSSRSIILVLWLVGILVFIALAHKKITKALKLTSVVITQERLFMAPPEDYVKKAGWAGPRDVADIVFTEQLSAIKGQMFGSNCLVFTSINPVYQKISSERLPLNKRYIPCANIDAAYGSLPSFLKSAEFQFDDGAVDKSTVVYERAQRFLRDRKTKLGHS